MRFNKWMVEDEKGRYEKDANGTWWMHLGIKKPTRTRALPKKCAHCGNVFLNCPSSGLNSQKLTRFCSKRCGGKWLQTTGLTPVGKKGAEAPAWKGGKLKTRDGYMYVYMPDHPALKGTTRLYVRRCRLVMEQHLGRQLESWEQVHHKNNIKDDDRIENLELWIISHPAGTTEYYCPHCNCEKCKAQRKN